jgi:hypothetical protein
MTYDRMPDLRPHGIGHALTDAVLQKDDAAGEAPLDNPLEEEKDRSLPPGGAVHTDQQTANSRPGSNPR